MRKAVSAKYLVVEDWNASYWVDIDLTQLTFPGGEPHFQLKNLINKFDTPVVIEAHVTNGDEFMQIFVLNDLLRRAGFHCVYLYIPYFPGARQDRSDGTTALTTKVYADMVNQANFDKVVVVDPHSDVTPALIDNVIVVPQTDVFSQMRNMGYLWEPGWAVLVAPDGGAIKKTEAIAQEHGYEVVYGRKHRDMATGKLSRFSCDPIPKGKRVIVGDDICDGGGTFLGLANAISRDSGLDWSEMKLVVTHGIFSNTPNLVELNRVYSGGIITTDSFRDSHYETFPKFVPLTDHVLTNYLSYR